MIVGEIINTPAAYIFDVEIGELPHPPLLPKSAHIRFRPVVNPPTHLHGHNSPGTYESQVSKNIRSLLLSHPSIRAECLGKLKGIKVPTARNPHAIVRFNPEKHVICLYKVVDLTHRGCNRIGPVEFISWVKDNADLLTDLDFEINHLAFLGEGGCGNKKTIIFFRNVFHSLRNMYGAFTDLPRKYPSEPIDLVCPTLNPTQALSPTFAYIARHFWKIVKDRRMSSGMQDRVSEVYPFN